MKFLKQNYISIGVIAIASLVTIFVAVIPKDKFSEVYHTNKTTGSGYSVLIDKISNNVLDETVVEYSLGVDLEKVCDENDCFMIIRRLHDDIVTDSGPVLNLSQVEDNLITIRDTGTGSTSLAVLYEGVDDFYEVESEEIVSP
jgi:hypothetical protein